MNPSLYKAATLGDIGFLKRIGDDGSIDLLTQKTPKDNNVFHIAAEFKHIEFFKQQFSIGDQSALFWATNKKGDTPLHVAARIGCDEIVKLLIELAEKVDEENGAADSDAQDKKVLRIINLQKDTALHVATRYGHHGVVTLLMAADPELCCLINNANESPLFLATRRGFSPIASSILNECRITPSFLGTNGVTALHVAVTHLDRELVKIMVSKSSEIIGAVDALGWTPLHYAALKGCAVIAQMLLEGDSSVIYILDKSGMSALHVAAYTGHTNVMKKVIRCRPDTCDLLNDQGQTVLHVAVLGGQSRVVNYILKTPKLAGLINEADKDGNTPLHLAAISKNRKLVLTLARDRRVDKTAINNEFSMVVDILLGGSNMFQQDGDKRIVNHLSLGNSTGVRFFHAQIVSDFMTPPIGNNTSFTPAIGDEGEQLPGDSVKKLRRLDTNMLVATLIATVTFAAVFAVPGGFKSDGTPVLQDKASFQLFLISNAFSFMSSTLAVFFNFFFTYLYEAPSGIRGSFIQCSIIGMMVAFASGTYVVLPIRYKPLGVLVYVICGYICLLIMGVYYTVPRSRLERKIRWVRTRRF